MNRRRLPLVVLGIPVLGILLHGVASAQSPAGALQLAAVEVTGAKRYTPAEVVRLSGLAPGTSVTSAHFDAATKLMTATGLFAEISYRYTTTAGKTTVIFTIQEAEWTMPVVLDNFVWFKDDEIVAALRQRVPSFDGTAPILEGVTELLTRELQALLKAKAIAGTVEFFPQALPDEGDRRVHCSAFEIQTRSCARSSSRGRRRSRRRSWPKSFR